MGENGDFWRSWPAFYFIAGVALRTGQLTLEAGKCVTYALFS